MPIPDLLHHHHHHHATNFVLDQGPPMGDGVQEALIKKEEIAHGTYLSLKKMMEKVKNVDGGKTKFTSKVGSEVVRRMAYDYLLWKTWGQAWQEAVDTMNKDDLTQGHVFNPGMSYLDDIYKVSTTDVPYVDPNLLDADGDTMGSMPLANFLKYVACQKVDAAGMSRGECPIAVVTQRWGNITNPSIIEQASIIPDSTLSHDVFAACVGIANNLQEGCQRRINGDKFL